MPSYLWFQSWATDVLVRPGKEWNKLLTKVALFVHIKTDLRKQTSQDDFKQETSCYAFSSRYNEAWTLLHNVIRIPSNSFRVTPVLQVHKVMRDIGLITNNSYLSVNWKQSITYLYSFVHSQNTIVFLKIHVCHCDFQHSMLYSFLITESSINKILSYTVSLLEILPEAENLCPQ